MRYGSAFLIFAILLSIFIVSCAPSRPAARSAPAPRVNASFDDPIAELIDSADTPLQSKTPLPRLGYTIQVGAFAQLDNAVRLERNLDRCGLEAYYFRHDSGLYKVRFGNFPSYEQARSAAQQLRTAGTIDAFYIVEPSEYAVARVVRDGNRELRLEMVKTARRFLGVPYRWGGTDSNEGFDCSGLTLTCYRLNGLDLPRVSRDQFVAGRWVAREALQPGDLVFFATRGGRQVTHVGIYIGAGNFIHAPRTGETVRIEKLSADFYNRTFVGGRSYL